MYFHVEIKMDNAAFQDGAAKSEISRILTKLAAKVVQDGVSDAVSLFDINGNNVGVAHIGRFSR